MVKCAKLRRAGVQFIDRLIKEGQMAHPMEQMRRNARYSTGLRNLWSEYDIAPEDVAAQQAAMAGNDEYYNRMRKLYDTMMSPEQLAQYQQEPTQISAENAPKVVSAPK